MIGLSRSRWAKKNVTSPHLSLNVCLPGSDVPKDRSFALEIEFAMTLYSVGSKKKGPKRVVRKRLSGREEIAAIHLHQSMRPCNYY